MPKNLTQNNETEYVLEERMKICSALEKEKRKKNIPLILHRHQNLCYIVNNY